MKRALIITISIFAFSLSAQAVELTLEDCAAIEDPVKRFACYDRLAGRSPADTEKESDKAVDTVDPMKPGADETAPTAPAVMPTAPAVESKPDTEAVFGLEQKLNKDRPDKLQLKWARKKKDAHGKWIIVMENGQVWRQTDTRFFDFRNSEQLVVLSRGFAGGFFLAEPGSHVRIRVKRVK